MLNWTMNTKATPHKWLLIVYFVSKHATIIIKFPSINFLLSHLKYVMRLTFTLLVFSLHKINVLVCVAAPLNTWQASDLRQRVHESFYSVAAWQRGFWRSRGRRCERAVSTVNIRSDLPALHTCAARWLGSPRVSSVFSGVFWFSRACSVFFGYPRVLSGILGCVRVCSDREQRRLPLRRNERSSALSSRHIIITLIIIVALLTPQ